MKAVMVMFDSLNRRFLPPYGAPTWVHAPNFERLAQRSVRFDTCYAGSMPCMPARRELHTGRYNFLHRSWGPIEPFDDSVMELLGKSGVYTHLITDHQHYWEDGGATYHNRYRTYEFFRGQEGDAWKGHVADPEIPESHRAIRHELWRQDWVNRQYLDDPADHPQNKVFDAGLEFMTTNRDADRWFVQIEAFDPHEPYFSYADHKRWYANDYDGPHFDWPDYKVVDEAPELIEHARREYAALLTMCDESLGRVLDHFDAHDLWRDTMLIVCTDHGFLLGEHNWWGKNNQPWFDENIHTPLFIWDPRSGASGESRDALVQTIDFGPTLLEFFGAEPTERMEGRALRDTIAANTPVRDAGLFGSYGGFVNVTDGRYVYMRCAATPDNRPLYEHTLMPTHMNMRFSPEELVGAELVPPFDFTQGNPLIRVPGIAFGDVTGFGTRLYDLATDPEQEVPLLDPEQELRMIRLLLRLMRANDAPPSQYVRLGLPVSGEPDASHLLCSAQHHDVVAADAPLPRPDEFRVGPLSVNATLGSLLADPRSAPLVTGVLGPQSRRIASLLGDQSLVELAAFNRQISTEVLTALDIELAALSSS